MSTFYFKWRLLKGHKAKAKDSKVQGSGTKVSDLFVDHSPVSLYTKDSARVSTLLSVPLALLYQTFTWAIG